MTMKAASLLAIAAAIVTAGSAFALTPACDAPSPPTLPETGLNLAFDDLNALAETVSAFDDEITGYRACLDNVLANTADYSREDVLGSLAAYNEIDGLQNAVWDRYAQLTEQWTGEQEKNARLAANAAAEQALAEVQSTQAVNLRR